MDHSPHFWFLLREGADYYLDVNCGQGAVGLSVLLKLSVAECAEYHGLGRVFIDGFAARVADGSRGYMDRDLSSSLGDEVSAAVSRFRAR